MAKKGKATFAGLKARRRTSSTKRRVKIRVPKSMVITQEV